MINSVLLDVDGVLTDGSFWYSNMGKTLKRFGSHDGQAIKIALNFFKVSLITADVRGFDISQLRANDMNVQCVLVSEEDRASWIAQRYEKSSTALVADSFSDIPSIDKVGRSFAPNNAHPAFKAKVDVILEANSGEGAVAEALDILLMENYGIHLWQYEE